MAQPQDEALPPGEQPPIAPLGASTSRSLVGGKAASLARLIAAGFPVPPGFVVTTAAWRAASPDPATGRREPGPELLATCAQAWRALGAPAVAVRSSATGEDAAGISLAGQYDTVLSVTDEAGLVSAVTRIWRSLDSEHATAYRSATQRISKGGLATATQQAPREQMAVIVQAMVPARVSGVLFTVDPNARHEDEMLIEATWGLGESLVSGQVQPDTLRVARTTAEVREARIADKPVWIPAGERAAQPTPLEMRGQPCLAPAQVKELSALALRIETYYGSPQDVEWAITADGELWLLQSRDITTLGEAREHSRFEDDARERVARELAAGHGPFVLHNLGETLAHPTPLSWSVWQRFMSGRGGFGRVYRQAGFEPSPALETRGFVTLFAGRIYSDLSLASELFFAGYPYSYDLEQIRRDPSAADRPPTLVTGSWRARRAATRRLRAAADRIAALARHHDDDLTDRILPELAAWCREEAALDLTLLSNQGWIAAWDRRERYVMDELAPATLLPSLIVGRAMGELEACLAEHCWREDCSELTNWLASPPGPDSTVAATALLWQLAQEIPAGVALAEREQGLADWLARFGHRAPGEMDLATPRWRERPESVRALLKRLETEPDPLERYGRHQQEVASRIEQLRSRLADGAREELDGVLVTLRRYLRWREDGKDALVSGLEMLRQLALDAGRRLELGDDVFLLSLPEVRLALTTGDPRPMLVSMARRERAAETRLELPRILDERFVAAGRMTVPEPGAEPASASGVRLTARSLSVGVATGLVRRVMAADQAGDLGAGYILVCAATDPAWTPLLTGAAALVMERGGSLSHGAVVARELGVPAVVLEGALGLLHEGEEVTVDGRGLVLRQGEKPPASEKNDIVPPPLGRRERRAARLTGMGLTIWSAFLIACWWLPESWLYQPALATLDLVGWPLVTRLGYPGAVAAIATGVACLAVAGQRLLTDNDRLLELKARAASARQIIAAKQCTPEQKQRLADCADQATSRLLLAAMTPLAAGLGPLVLVFLWLPARVDPASWNATPGSPVDVAVAVAGDFPGEVLLVPASGLTLDSLTPAARQMPALREALLGLRAELADPAAPESAAIEVALASAPEASREAMLADLDAYLQAGIAPQAISWRVVPPEKSGSFSVRVRAGADTLEANVVLGNESPPALQHIEGSRDGTLRSLDITYAPPAQRRIFWQPLRKLGIAWDAGWLWTYLAVYLPAMFLAKRLLRVA